MTRVSKRHADPVVRLRKAIETGYFLPGQRLPEVELAEWLGVNRVNVKLALGKLDQEGLVEVERNKGARVRVISQQEAIEILQTYASLEMLIARNAAAKATAADCERLKSILAAITQALAEEAYVEYSQHIGKLHAEIRRIAAHSTATRIIATLNVQIARFRAQTVLFPGRIQQSLRELEKIVDAICAADGVRAGQAMLEHLNNMGKALEQSLTRIDA
ncbi:GntR family transcriptional regulator [Agrobacterium rhizogenes]|uniref:GntR family transcriptional regulator n=1 Tax=Rhizobium rhizogenes TaxID=359 RepID=UPI0009F5325F|nr:GntR family transcriptional regulator [Rhizobium rhizogenes]NTI46372.1 GntR family transcriptional regulator [Rhizobium rhizogenes]NTI53055.1 GntR family transcriptional regulator [Rhizobium rhizogenes]NTI98428.1 GntR family transcriptional regulator [Rhizobium rhizogenes]NTJ60856.1 GntR family transcriptional regulator [Rhizobium rhizogenes]